MAIGREDTSGGGSNPLVGQATAQLLPTPQEVGGLAAAISRGPVGGPASPGLGLGGQEAGPDSAPALLRSQ